MDVENDRVEWSGCGASGEECMWRMSKWSVCGQYMKRIRFLLSFAKTNSSNTLICLFVMY